VSHVGLAIIAMGGYGVTAVLLKVVLRHIAPEVVLVATNTVLVAAALALMLYRHESLADSLSLGWPTALLFVTGLTLSLSIISYYLALSRGPASVVLPIFAMSFAVATVLGILFLGEDIKATKVVGVGLATVSIVLLTR
jgi:transporter family protein